jgi:hypothetical protein
MIPPLAIGRMQTGKKDFVPATKQISLDLKQSYHRTLDHICEVHSISRRKMATKLLEGAIFREAQALDIQRTKP